MYSLHSISLYRNYSNSTIVFSENNKDPIKELEITSAVDFRQLNYKQTFYYSDIYIDRYNQEVLLSATSSIRNTTLKKSLYINKIDYYGTNGELIKSYIKNLIKLPPMATLNYVVEKEENKGGPGTDFIIDVEGLDDTVKAVMIGDFSNKAFAFNTQGTPVVH